MFMSALTPMGQWGLIEQCAEHLEDAVDMRTPTRLAGSQLKKRSQNLLRDRVSRFRACFQG